jgi:hypothetical protein
MTGEQFKAAMRRRPFVPFVIRTADGEALPVRHPEHVAISTSGRTILVSTDDDAHVVIDLLLVTRLDVEAPRQQPAGREDGS